MSKLPVGDTAVGAIKFGLGNMFTTMRLGWVAILLSIILAGLVGWLLSGGIDFSVFEALADMDDADFGESAEALHAIGVLYAVLIASIVVGSIAFIPLTVILSRMASGVEDAPNGIGYFRFGGTELLYLIGGILSMILYLLVSGVAFLPGIASFGWGIFSGLHGEASAFGDSTAGLAGALGILLLIGGGVLVAWFALRMVTFLPLIAAEGRLGLPTALQSTKGNVWRILGAGILFILLLYVAEIVFTIGAVVVLLIFAFLYHAAASASETLGILVIAFGGFIGLSAFLLYLMFSIAASVGFPALVYKHLQLKN